MRTRANLPTGTVLGLLVALPCTFSSITPASARNVDQHQPADPAGTVEIVNVAGSIAVNGWDRPEVSVTGQVGSSVDRVELTSSDHHTLARVVLPHGIGLHFGGDGSAHLTIRVPAHGQVGADQRHLEAAAPHALPRSAAMCTYLSLMARRRRSRVRAATSQ